VLIAAAATLAGVGQTYRRDLDYCQRLYTRSVKQRDIADDTHNALSALQDAAINAKDYVLTEETGYLEAYRADIQRWQDESGTLELEARSDPAAPLVQDLSKAAGQTLRELAQMISLHDEDAQQQALDRIRKGSGIVYLEQARGNGDKIQQLDGLGADEANQSLIRSTLQARRRLAAGGVVLFCLVIAEVLIQMFGVRLERKLITGLTSRSKPSFEPAG